MVSDTKGETALFDALLPNKVVNLEEVVWDNVDVDEEGKATGVFGLLFADLSLKQLRTVCSRLKLKGVKNVTKKDMLQQLVEHHNNWKNYNQV